MAEDTESLDQHPMDEEADKVVAVRRTIPTPVLDYSTQLASLSTNNVIQRLYEDGVARGASRVRSYVRELDITTGTYREQLELYPELQTCEYCSSRFTDREALQQHRWDWTVQCTRCKTDAFITCRSGKRPHKKKKIHCPGSFGGCYEHNVCFDNNVAELEHAEKNDHRQCYIEGCKSQLKKKLNKPEEVLKHITEVHMS